MWPFESCYTMCRSRSRLALPTTSMSESQPLLAQDPDVTDRGHNVEGRATTRKETVAQFLESGFVHKVVIALV